MTATALLSLMPAARIFATRDIDNQIAAGTARAVERDHLIRISAETIACSAHLRGWSVERYVSTFAPELVAIREAVAAGEQREAA